MKDIPKLWLKSISWFTKEVEAHKTWCKAHSLTGRVWISEKGLLQKSVLVVSGMRLV